MLSLIVFSILWMVTYSLSAVTHELSSDNLFDRIKVHHGWELNTQYLHQQTLKLEGVVSVVVGMSASLEVVGSGPIHSAL